MPYSFVLANFCWLLMGTRPSEGERLKWDLKLWHLTKSNELVTQIERWFSCSSLLVMITVRQTITVRLDAWATDICWTCAISTVIHPVNAVVYLPSTPFVTQSGSINVVRCFFVCIPHGLASRTGVHGNFEPMTYEEFNVTNLPVCMLLFFLTVCICITRDAYLHNLNKLHFA